MLKISETTHFGLMAGCVFGTQAFTRYPFHPAFPTPTLSCNWRGFGQLAYGLTVAIICCVLEPLCLCRPLCLVWL